MNAESLLAHYAQIADAPGAITRLRQFVLDLAVRGKLVAQIPGEEAASQLLASIADARASAGAGDSFPPVSPEDQPFDLPVGWAWSRVGAVCSKTGSGSTPRGGQSAYKKKGIVFLRSQNIYNDGLRLDDVAFIDEETHLRMSGTAVHPSDLLLNITGGSMGRCCRVPDQFDRANISQHVAIIRAAVMGMSDFLHCLVLSPYFQSFIFDEQTGAGRGGLPKNRMDRIAIALPPLAEQHRIVAKVDELMALCDQLEATQAQREATRDRLAAASLARLNAPDPDTFPTDARFALDALPALTTRPDQIKQLRQTILNLAVRGKLVPQDSSDESAATLLARVPSPPRPVRFDKRSPELIPGDCGLSINDPKTNLPNGWIWTPLVRVARLESGHTPSRNRPDWWGGAVPWIGLVDARIHNNAKIFETIQTTNEEGLANSAARLLPAGTVCFSRTASVGYVIVMGRPMATSQDFVNWVPSEAISSEWLQLVMIAERPAIGRFSKGAVHKTIYYPAWLSMHVALPPLAEQHRIVAKVNELMALCDQLEASLTTGEATRSRLLNAVLHEALSPATTVSVEHPRAAVSGYVVSRLASRRSFGRTAHMKHLYLAESRLGLKLGGRYMREAAGPLDTGIYELEKQAEAAGWYTYNVEKLPLGKGKVSYVPGKALKALAEEGATVLGPSRKEMDRLIDLMGGLQTEQVEIIATLFAAWNDALLDGHTPNDDWIVKEVREHWHASKQRFKPDDLRTWLGWMRQNDVVPLGHPPRTMQQTMMEL